MVVLGPVDSPGKEDLGHLEVNTCCSVRVWGVGDATWVEVAPTTCEACVWTLIDLVAQFNAGDRPSLLGAAPAAVT